MFMFRLGAVTTSSGKEFQTSTALWLKKVFPEVKAALMFIEFKRVTSSCSILCHLEHVIS